MIVLYGRRNTRIKTYKDHQQACKNCNALNLEVRVYREYFHIFFIPITTIGANVVEMSCNSCGQPMRLESLRKHYENVTRTPFYLYSGVILLVGLILTITTLNLKSQNEKATFVEKPQVGDVYLIRKEDKNAATYYFLKIANINADTVTVFHNNLEYNSFVSQLNAEDYFVKEDKLLYLKSEIKQMLDKMEINSVSRNYSEDKGFNRIK